MELVKTRRIRGHCIDCGTGTAGNKSVRCYKCNGSHRRIHADISIYRRNWHLSKKYGLDPGEFDAMWMAFRGECGICKCKMKMPTKTKGQAMDTVTVDHDHKTGRVRGLLCSACNKGIGHLKDDVNRLRSAIEWLSNTKS